MSYMKSISEAKAKSKKTDTPEYEGPLDVLVVSPVTGEPWFFYFKKEQISKHGTFSDFKTFIKQYKHDSEVRWSFTYDKKDRWHSVRCPPALHARRLRRVVRSLSTQ